MGTDSGANRWYRVVLLVVLCGLLIGGAILIARRVQQPTLPRNVPVSTTGNLLLIATNESGAPLRQAVLSVDGIPGQSGVRDDGTCRLAVPPGEYTLRGIAPTPEGTDPPQYHPRSATLLVAPGSGARALISIEAWSASTPWEALVAGVGALAEGDATVTITYSFMKPGVYVAHGADGRSVVLADYAPGGTADVSAAQFAEEVRSAFAVWADAFTDAFCPAYGFGGTLTVVFEEHIEPGVNAPSLFDDYVATTAGVGDIRVGMWAQGIAGRVLAYTYGPDNVGSSIAGDMLFNASVDWKLDAAGPAVPAYSILRTAVHELGHAWGLLHSASQQDVMYPYVSTGATFATQFPDGLAQSQTLLSALLGVYAPAQATVRAVARDASLAQAAVWPT